MAAMSVAERRQRAAVAAAALEVDAITAQVVGAFGDAGVPSLLLKGPVVAAWLYGPAEVRLYEDVDLLVAPDRLGDAEQVLAALGFRYVFEAAHAVEEPTHARTWVRGDNPPIDLHTSLRVLPPDTTNVWDALAEGSVELVVAGRQVAAPRRACLAFIVALHALQRGPDERQLLDELRRALAAGDGDVWREATALAGRLGAGGHLRAALGLVPGGAELADRLELPAAPVRAAIMATASADARACALRLDRIGASSSWREKASLLVRAAIPTPGYMRATGGPPGMSLAARYHRRLLRLRGVVAGYAVWRSAIRACGASRRISDRIEVVLWSLIARAGIAWLGINTTLRLLDRVGLKRRGGDQLASTQRDALFRIAGRCLGESVARSQYLRARGVRHDLVLGVSGPFSGLRAHAWLEPLDAGPAGFEIIHRVSR